MLRNLKKEKEMVSHKKNLKNQQKRKGKNNENETFRENNRLYKIKRKNKRK